MTKEDLQSWERNEPVAKDYLLEKFKGLRFYFPDKDVVYKVCNKKFDWKGKDDWVAIPEKEESNDSDGKPTVLTLVCKFVAEHADKNEGITIVKAPESYAIVCLYSTVDDCKYACAPVKWHCHSTRYETNKMKDNKFFGVVLLSF